ncbi:MAG TPA: hypothetical protein VHQ65_08295 [Thermoanaerobaculia bacterium]|nr:hypothetical protein [Thermoanaerobaculia bacterium]
MIALLLVGVALALLAAVHFFWVAEGRVIFGPESFFLALALGTYGASAFLAGPVSRPYVLYLGAGIAAFLLGTMASRLFHRFEHRRELAAFTAAPWQDDLRGARCALVVALALFSLVVTASYFYLLGFYVPLAALRTLVSDGPQAMIATYNQLRAATSSAAGAYLGLGYVSQFKDTLLPLITILFFFRWRLQRDRVSRAVFLVLMGCTALAAVGTGARFHLAFFGASLTVMGLAPYMRPLRFSRRQMVVVAVVLMTVLSALTLMMGARGMKTLDVPILWAPYQVVERAFISPSEQRLEVYERFLVEQPPQWGLATLRELRSILPGRLPVTLSNQLHELLFGSPYGNVALDTWGALWYDFQWLGVLVAFAIGFLMNAYYVWMLRGPKRLVRLVTLGYAGLILGISTDLQVLILHGFLTCFLFLAVLAFGESLGWLQRWEDKRLSDSAPAGA